MSWTKLFNSCKPYFIQLESGCVWDKLSLIGFNLSVKCAASFKVLGTKSSSINPTEVIGIKEAIPINLGLPDYVL